MLVVLSHFVAPILPLSLILSLCLTLIALPQTCHSVSFCRSVSCPFTQVALSNIVISLFKSSHYALLFFLLFCISLILSIYLLCCLSTSSLLRFTKCRSVFANEEKQNKLLLYFIPSPYSLLISQIILRTSVSCRYCFLEFFWELIK